MASHRSSYMSTTSSVSSSSTSLALPPALRSAYGGGRRSGTASGTGGAGGGSGGGRRSHALRREVISPTPSSASSYATQGSSRSTSGLSSAPIEVQEAVVIEDLLSLLMGIEGKHIHFAEGPFPMRFLDSELRLTPEDLVNPEYFAVSDALDASLRDFVTRLLPLASCHEVISAFIQSYSEFMCGYVNHAIAAAMRTVLKEYMLVLVQLEHEFRARPGFSLQKCWYYLAPSLATLRACAEVCVEIHTKFKPLQPSAASSRLPSVVDLASHGLAAGVSSLSLGGGGGREDHGSSDVLMLGDGAPPVREWHHVGGGVLGMLCDRYVATSGDPHAKRLHQYLLSHAAKPFLELLREWIHLGKVERDKYQEFMVIKHDLKKHAPMSELDDAYWDKCYELRPGAVPPFLADYATMIMHTGKYLNVYIDCNSSIRLAAEDMAQRAAAAAAAAAASASAASGPRTVALAAGGTVLNELAVAVDGTGAYLAEIEAAHRVANRHVLDLLFNKTQLVPRLKSLKHFMLLDQSDWFDHFLDSALTELQKPYDQVRLAKVQSLLDVAARNPASVTCTDPYKEHVKVKMDAAPLFDQLLAIVSVTSEIPGLTSGTVASTLLGTGGGGGADETTATATTAASAASKKLYSGLQAMILDHEIKFPLSIVFSKRAMVKYQILFRNLAQLKLLDRQLGASWLMQTRKVPASRHPRGFTGHGQGGHAAVAPSVVTDALEQIGARIALLRMRMLALVQAITGYLTVDVIEPKHQLLERALAQAARGTAGEPTASSGPESAQTVDGVLKALHDFLDDCLRDAFLSSDRLLPIYRKLVEAVDRFIRVYDAYVRLSPHLAASAGSARGVSASDAERLHRVERSLTQIEAVWVYHMRLFLNGLKKAAGNETQLFLVLYNRIDLNGFYMDGQTEGVMAGY
ncbi:gamma tubulin complex Spc97/GCP2 subunit Alp4 [Blastocladiella emersonii ATCC 22665]|nr:gamma tubulin complex Spc97/GCP2 subunit Alp4 [Blastocladiella emersonii ATCC 22665]